MNHMLYLLLYTIDTKKELTAQLDKMSSKRLSSVPTKLLLSASSSSEIEMDKPKSNKIAATTDSPPSPQVKIYFILRFNTSIL